MNFPSAELQAARFALGAVVTNSFSKFDLSRQTTPEGFKRLWRSQNFGLSRAETDEGSTNRFDRMQIWRITNRFPGGYSTIVRRLHAVISIALPWFMLSVSVPLCRAQGDAAEFATLSRTCNLYRSSIDAECIRVNQSELEQLYFQGNIPPADKVEIARQLLYSYTASPSDLAALHDVVQKLDEYKHAAALGSSSTETLNTASASTDRTKVYNPCSTGKLVIWGVLAGLNHVPVGATGLPPGCADALNIAATPSTDDATSVPPEAGAEPSTGAASAATIGQNTPASSPRFVRGLPQCTRTQYQSQGASLWLLNSCNVPVNVEFTSDSGNTWGQVTVVNAGSRVELTAIGIGYDPRKDGTVYLFTCPSGSQPVMPNGNAIPLRNYKGEFTCAVL